MNIEKSHEVWFEHNGWWPEKGKVIHHINGNHEDNRISNLWLLTKSEHNTLHAVQGDGPYSPEARASRGAAMKGNKNSLGRKLSEETKAKIAAALKGKRHSAEHRAKNSAAKMGNKNALRKEAQS